MAGALSGLEIQTALTKFAARWQSYTGGERAEAQTYLNELFAGFGSDRAALGARFEDFQASAGFMDLHWPGVCIVEMKAPNKTLDSAREQVKRSRPTSSRPASPASGRSILPPGIDHHKPVLLRQSKRIICDDSAVLGRSNHLRVRLRRVAVPGWVNGGGKARDA